MIFELVKLTGGLMMPVPVILVLLVVGLVLVVASRFRRLGIGFIAVGTVLLLVVSLPWLSERALRDLEQDYPVLREPPQAEWIVVLGGGSRDNQSLPPASRLGESSMYRLAEGVRIAKLLPDARLVTSGGGSGGKGLATAELMEEVAVEWGIEASRIITLTSPRNTEAEARGVKSLRAEDRGRKTEDRRQRAEDRKERTEGGRLRTEGRRRRTEDRREKTESGRRRTEG